MTTTKPIGLLLGACLLAGLLPATCPADDETFDDRYRSLLPRAEMVLYEQQDTARGLALLKAALNTKRIHIRERSEALFRLAEHLEERRDYDAALAWLGGLKDLPCDLPLASDASEATEVLVDGAEARCELDADGQTPRVGLALQGPGPHEVTIRYR